ncbi:hypothetical protein R5R35_005581 [Gryllus longicercus]|uniref:Uncharacterized protein n=1 Tax=Gryllus longicercus TaxID=2509291 RepID=A0AAN9Z132_9ORTH
MVTEDTELNNVKKLKNSDSFQFWDFEIQILCKEKQLGEVVSGAKLLCECGSDEHKQKTRHTEDAKAQYCIVRTIDKMVKKILACGTSKEMYDTLKTIYTRDTAQLKQQLLMDFHGLKYDETKDITI